ncbi:MAG: hypothetical protein U0840_13050 [Gemmataceae bacterium]
MARKKTARGAEVWRLGAGVCGVAIGCATAALLLAVLGVYDVRGPGGLYQAYYLLGAGSGLLLGLTFPSEISAAGEEERPRDLIGGFLAVGVLLFGLGCVFLAWSWTPYRVLSVCTAIAKGTPTSSVTRTTYQKGQVIGSETGYGFTYVVGGVTYRGGGDSTTVRYDPARPDVYHSDNGLEAKQERLGEAPWVFAGGVAVLVVGVLFAMRDRVVWAQMWAGAVVLVLLAGGIATGVIVWDESTLGPRLAGKVERATPQSPEPPPQAGPGEVDQSGKGLAPAPSR